MPNDHADDRLVKAHEDRMEGIEKWCSKLEKKVDQIPWILLAALFNLVLTGAGIIVMVVK